MTIDIDRLTLRLPPGYEVRAAHIARRVAHSIGEIPTSGRRQIARLNVRRIEVDRSTSDADLVHRITSSIAGQLKESKRS